ncbi:Myotubularin- protein 14 [Blastocladiella emersonii ATCC 22665]|nr:Myotubularin- protein 14 [Blastocladiella emersonii ATCC 22665]
MAASLDSLPPLTHYFPPSTSPPSNHHHRDSPEASLISAAAAAAVAVMSAASPPAARAAAAPSRPPPFEPPPLAEPTPTRANDLAAPPSLASMRSVSEGSGLLLPTPSPTPLSGLRAAPTDAHHGHSPTPPSSAPASTVSESDLHALLTFFWTFQPSQRADDSVAPVLRAIHERVHSLFARDYAVAAIHNDACKSYPEWILVPETEDPDGLGPLVNDAAALRSLFHRSRFARVRSRFVVPVLAVNGRNICRSATLSNEAEVLLNRFGEKTRQLLSGYGSFGPSTGATSPSASAASPTMATMLAPTSPAHASSSVPPSGPASLGSKSPSLGFRSSAPRSPTSPTRASARTGSEVTATTSPSDLLLDASSEDEARATTMEKQRTADIALLNALHVVDIFDLMVEHRKVKYGLTLTSSEKADTHNRYQDFHLVSVPYPGVEFFREFKDNRYCGRNLRFDWSQTFVDAELHVARASILQQLSAGAASSSLPEWDAYKSWDIITMTQNYLKLILASLSDDADASCDDASLPKPGILVHCISGWDRTPAFVSWIRLSLWADGLAHASLAAEEVLYLTVAYDWLLFNHLLCDRTSRGEDIFAFCFYMLLFILDEREFGVRGSGGAARRRPRIQQPPQRQQQQDESPLPPPPAVAEVEQPAPVSMAAVAPRQRVPSLSSSAPNLTYAPAAAAAAATESTTPPSRGHPASAIPVPPRHLHQRHLRRISRSGTVLAPVTSAPPTSASFDSAASIPHSPANSVASSVISVGCGLVSPHASSHPMGSADSDATAGAAAVTPATHVSTCTTTPTPTYSSSWQLISMLQGGSQWHRSSVDEPSRGSASRSPASGGTPFLAPTAPFNAAPATVNSPPMSPDLVSAPMGNASHAAAARRFHCDDDQFDLEHEDDAGAPPALPGLALPLAARNRRPSRPTALAHASASATGGALSTSPFSWSSSSAAFPSSDSEPFASPRSFQPPRHAQPVATTAQQQQQQQQRGRQRKSSLSNPPVTGTTPASASSHGWLSSSAGSTAWSPNPNMVRTTILASPASSSAGSTRPRQRTASNPPHPHHHHHSHTVPQVAGGGRQHRRRASSVSSSMTLDDDGLMFGPASPPPVAAIPHAAVAIPAPAAAAAGDDDWSQSLSASWWSHTSVHAPAAAAAASLCPTGSTPPLSGCRCCSVAAVMQPAQQPPLQPSEDEDDDLCLVDGSLLIVAPDEDEDEMAGKSASASSSSSSGSTHHHHHHHHGRRRHGGGKRRKHHHGDAPPPLPLREARVDDVPDEEDGGNESDDEADVVVPPPLPAVRTPGSSGSSSSSLSLDGSKTLPDPPAAPQQQQLTRRARRLLAVRQLFARVYHGVANPTPPRTAFKAPAPVAKPAAAAALATSTALLARHSAPSIPQAVVVPVSPSPTASGVSTWSTASSGATTTRSSTDGSSWAQSLSHMVSKMALGSGSSVASSQPVASSSNSNSNASLLTASTLAMPPTWRSVHRTTTPTAATSSDRGNGSAVTAGALIGPITRPSLFAPSSNGSVSPPAPVAIAAAAAAGAEPAAAAAGAATAASAAEKVIWKWALGRSD